MILYSVGGYESVWSACTHEGVVGLVARAKISHLDLALYKALYPLPPRQTSSKKIYEHKALKVDLSVLNQENQ